MAVTAFGMLIAMVAWLPLVLRRLPLSVPIIFIVLGGLFFALPFTPRTLVPIEYPGITERATEFVVIIALMGAGLKLDRVFGWGRWCTTWLLLGLTMPLSILAITALGFGLLGLPLATALLLGASLAPTDPVLAADVQVGPPRTGEEDEVRFGLTSEAGLNDGFAFPFVHLAIALCVAASTGEPWLLRWLSLNVVWEIAAGALVGWLVGYAFGWITFRIPAGSKLAKSGDGFIALAATFVSYGVTEMAHAYGFLAVFVTAMAFRHSHRDHDFHHQMHDFIEQVERVTLMVVLLLFGGALVCGLLAPLQPADIAAALAIVLLVRPLAGLIGLVPSTLPFRDKAMLAFFGIRGIGSFYYLAYGLNHAPFAGGERLWAVVGLIVALSVFLHGVTVTPLMRRFDRARGVDPDREDAAEVAEPVPAEPRRS
jgi:sodium/hydrogen antiporter